MASDSLRRFEEARKRLEAQGRLRTAASTTTPSTAPMEEAAPARTIPGTGGVVKSDKTLGRSIFEGIGNTLMGLFNPDDSAALQESQTRLQESRKALQSAIFKNQSEGKDTSRLRKMERDIVVGLDDSRGISSAVGLGQDIRKAVTERPAKALEYVKEEAKGIGEDVAEGGILGAAGRATQLPVKAGVVGAGQIVGAAGDVIGSGIMRGGQAALSEEQKAGLSAGAQQMLDNDFGRAAIDAFSKGAEAYQKFKEANPQDAVLVESIGNVLSALPPLKAGQVGLRVAKEVGEQAVGAAMEAGEQVIKKGAKAGAKVLRAPIKAVQKTGDIAQSVVPKGMVQRTKEAVAGISPLEKQTLAPIEKVRAGIQAQVAAGKMPAEEAARRLSTVDTPMAKKALENSGDFEYYLRKAERARDTTQPTPLEFAGKKAEDALDQIGQKMSRSADLKKKVIAEIGDQPFEGIAAHRENFTKALEEQLGGMFNKEGNLVDAAGRKLKISLEPTDKSLVRDIYVKLLELGNKPTAREVDDTIDALQGILYKRRQMSAEPINTQAEGVIKRIIGQMNNELKSQLGPTYRKANIRYASLADVQDWLNRALGPQGQRGGSLLKAVFSPTDRGAKERFRTIAKITGIDLNDQAVLAKLAMEAVGDVRQRSLLESLGVIESGILQSARRLPIVGDLIGVGEAAAKVGIKTRNVAEEISKKARKGGQPRPKVQVPDKGTSNNASSILAEMRSNKIEPTVIQKITLATDKTPERKELFVVKKGDLPKYRIIDETAKSGSLGLAGKDQGGVNWHITAIDTSGNGVRLSDFFNRGFIYAGEATPDMLPSRSVGAEYTAASRKTSDAFLKSVNQREIGSVEGKKFEIGTFGDNHYLRKIIENKHDRFPKEELPKTIKMPLVQSSRASDDPTNYRFDNIAWVFKDKNEYRVIYTRENPYGNEEVIGWHTTKNPKYLEDLESFGTPDRIRTDELGLEGR